MSPEKAEELQAKMRSLLIECQSGAIASILGTDKKDVLTIEDAKAADAMSFTHGVKIVFDFGPVIGGLRVNASPGGLKNLLRANAEDADVMDMLKEFLNQTMGLLKRKLDAENTVGFFLPVVTRQYHDYYFDEFTEAGFAKCFWRIKINNSNIFCHFWSSIRDPEALEVKLAASAEPPPSSGVEFL